MLKNNRLAFLTAGFAGSLVIIGAGFSAWVFVGDETNLSSKVDAGIEVSEYLEVGRLQLVAEKEARSELNLDTYDYNLTEEQYNDLSKLVNEYSYRKIVFSEGNPDSTALDDGMQFLRFYNDKEMGIKTFKEEQYIEGEFLIPTRYENMGIKFHIGVRSTNIDIEPTEGIDEYIQLNDKYKPNINETDNLKKNYFTLNGINYSSFDSEANKGLYSFNKNPQTIKITKPDGTIEDYYAYSFKADLQEMFLYEEGKKPYNRDSVQDIYKAIQDAKNNGTIQNLWRINFEFASTLYQD